LEGKYVLFRQYHGLALRLACLFIRYSTIWLARALPTDGKLITLELSSHHAKVCNKLHWDQQLSMTSSIVKVALENLKAAGVDNQATIMIGPAAESLAKLSSEDPYDLVFIDADKPSNSIYFSEAKRLVRKGGVIVRLALLSLFTD
jgi:predicted O-methyltransferase YrrM